MMRINSISNISLYNRQNVNFGKFLDNDARNKAKDICYTRGTNNKRIKDPDVQTMAKLDNSKLVELYTEKDKKTGKKVLKAKINRKYEKAHDLDYDVECERKLYRMEHDLWFRNVGSYDRLYHLGRFAMAFAANEYYTNPELYLAKKNGSTYDEDDYIPSDHEIAEQYLRDRGMYDM